MTGEGCSLTSNTLHETAITKEHWKIRSDVSTVCDGSPRRTIGVVVDEVEAVLVEGSAEVRLSDGETDSVGETLAEGTSGDLNTVSVSGLRVTRGQGANLTEGLQIIQRELETKQMEHDVLESTTVCKVSSGLAICAHKNTYAWLLND